MYTKKKSIKLPKNIKNLLYQSHLTVGPLKNLHSNTYHEKSIKRLIRGNSHADLHLSASFDLKFILYLLGSDYK